MILTLPDEMKRPNSTLKATTFACSILALFLSLHGAYEARQANKTATEANLIATKANRIAEEQRESAEKALALEQRRTEMEAALTFRIEFKGNKGSALKIIPSDPSKVVTGVEIVCRTGDPRTGELHQWGSWAAASPDEAELEELMVALGDNYESCSTYFEYEGGYGGMGMPSGWYPVVISVDYVHGGEPRRQSALYEIYYADERLTKKEVVFSMRDVCLVLAKPVRNLLPGEDAAVVQEAAWHKWAKSSFSNYMKGVPVRSEDSDKG